MENCTKCGHEIFEGSKYCKNCGSNLINQIDNKIDRNLDIVSENVSKVKKEISESQYLSSTKNAINSFIKKGIFFIGYLCLITCLIQLINHFILDKQSWLIESYYNNNLHSYSSDSFDAWFNYFGQIFPIYFSLGLIFFIGFKYNKKYFIYTSTIFLILFIFIFFNKKNVIENPIINIHNDINELTIDSTSTKFNYEKDDKKKDFIEESNYVEENKIIYNNSFNVFNENSIQKYNFRIESEDSSYGNCFLYVTENSKLIFKDSVPNSVSLIKKIDFEERYFYFESEAGGGSSGSFNIYYCVYDIKKSKLFKLDRYCPGNCDEGYYENLDEIREDTEIYNFLKSKIITTTNSHL